MATHKIKSRMVRQLRGGQITIPGEFRRSLGISENDLLKVTLRDGKLEVTPVETREKASQAWLKEMYDLFAPVRKEARPRSEGEINQLIGQAVREVRRARRR